MIDYKFDDATGLWTIKTKNGTYSAGEFVRLINSYLIKEGIPLDALEYLSGKYAELIATENVIVPTSNKNGDLTKSPAMFSSWVVIIMDYAQSFVYVNSMVNTTALDFKNREKAAAQAVKNFSQHVTGKPTYFGN